MNTIKMNLDGFNKMKEEHLHQIFSRTFYCEPKPEKELQFINQMFTRGGENEERVGLHASSIIQPGLCMRKLVLSLNYEPTHATTKPDPRLIRIFENGNYVHEKWQRLLIRAEYSEPDHMDYTCFDETYQLQYTPDILCYIPEFYKDDLLLGEIKSMCDNAYNKGTGNPEFTKAVKQISLYLHFKKMKRGFILCENKDTQDYRVHIVEYDYKRVEPYIEILESVNEADRRFKRGGGLPQISPKYNKTCGKCQRCEMKDACYGIGKGRIRL